MRNRRLSSLTKIALLLVVLLTAWVWQRVTVVRTIRANELLRTEVEMKLEMVDKVSARIARLQQRTRIEKIATEQLGLRPSPPGQQRPLPLAADGKALDQNGSWRRLNNSLRKFSLVTDDD